MSNDMHMVGHTLIWHNQIPDWVFFHKDGTKLSREELLIRMKNHIYKVVGRYKGKINAWDVVNEALNDDGSMRNSLWYQIIGDDYVAQAFKFAHEADPNAELYYNDYNLHKSSKADGAIQLINEIQNQGIRVTGIGMQGHWGLDYPTKEELEESIKKFKELGYIAITELDIDVLPNPSGYQGAELNMNESSNNELNPYKSFLPDTIENKQIVQFQMLHEVFLEHSNKINRVTTWGVTDGDSWKNEWPVPNRTNYPLLFDRNGKAKPIVDSIIQLVESN
jgi:endo-1,4-beta-xylanase